MDNVEMIDKKQAIKRIKEYTADVYAVNLNDPKQFAGDSHESYICEGLYEATELLDDLRTVNAAPVVRGHWMDIIQHDNVLIRAGTPITTTWETCSVCNCRTGFVGSKEYLGDERCPHCGAIMDEEVKI